MYEIFSNQFSNPLKKELTKRLLSPSLVTVESVQDKELILFLGLTGAGKSTTINWLKSLRAENMPALKVGIESHSLTLYPECVDASEIGPGIFYCDLPGLDDNRKNKEYEYCGALLSRLVIKAAKSIRAIVIVMDYSTIGTKQFGSLEKLISLCEVFFIDLFRIRQSVILLVNRVWGSEKAKDVVLNSLAACIKKYKVDLEDVKKTLVRDGGFEKMKQFHFFQFSSQESQSAFYECVDLNKKIRFLSMFNGKNTILLTQSKNTKKDLEEVRNKLRDIVYFSESFNIFLTSSHPNDEANIKRNEYLNSYLFYNSKLRYLESTECAVLLSDSAPQTLLVYLLPIESDYAYVRFAQDLYYVNRLEGSCVFLPLSSENILSFDKAVKIRTMRPGLSRLLSDQELDEIKIITSHTGGVEERFVKVRNSTEFASYMKTLQGKLKNKRDVQGDEKKEIKEEKLITFTFSRVELEKWLSVDDSWYFFNGVISKNDFNLRMNNSYINFFNLINDIAVGGCANIKEIFMMHDQLISLKKELHNAGDRLGSLRETQAILQENASSCWLYIMDIMPADIRQYRLSYIFVDPKLVYVTLNADYETVIIKDQNKFFRNLQQIYRHPLNEPGRIRLSPQQINKLIIDNGGHVRLGKKDFEEVLLKKLSEEHIYQIAAIDESLRVFSEKIILLKKEKNDYKLDGETLYWEDGVFFPKNIVVASLIYGACIVGAAFSTALPLAPIPVAAAHLIHGAASAATLHSISTQVESAITVVESLAHVGGSIVVAVNDIIEGKNVSEALRMDENTNAILRVGEAREFVYDDTVPYTSVSLFKDHGYFFNQKAYCSLQRFKHCVSFLPNPFFDTTAVVKIFAEKKLIPANQKWLRDIIQSIRKAEEEKDATQEEKNLIEHSYALKKTAIIESARDCQSGEAIKNFILSYISEEITKVTQVIQNSPEEIKQHEIIFSELKKNFSKDIETYILIARARLILNDDNSPKIMELERLVTLLDILLPHLVSNRYELISMSEVPKKNYLSSLPMGSSRGYIRVCTPDNRHFLFYVNKLKNECNLLKIDQKLLLQFDEEINLEKRLQEKTRSLDQSDLDAISRYENITSNSPAGSVKILGKSESSCMPF